MEDEVKKEAVRKPRKPKVSEVEVEGEPMDDRPIALPTAQFYKVRITKTATGKEIIKKLPLGTLQYVYPAQFDSSGRMKRDLQMKIELLEEVPRLGKPEKKPCVNC